MTAYMIVFAALGAAAALLIHFRNREDDGDV